MAEEQSLFIPIRCSISILFKEEAELQNKTYHTKEGDGTLGDIIMRKNLRTGADSKWYIWYFCYQGKEL